MKFTLFIIQVIGIILNFEFYNAMIDLKIQITQNIINYLKMEKNKMKKIVYVSSFILMFLAISFTSAFLNVDMDAEEAWGYYSDAILPSLIISVMTIGLSIYFEKKREANEDGL